MAAVRERFASPNIHIDIFDRRRPTFDGEDCELIQIAVYREGLPDDVLEFDAGDLVRRVRSPVFEAALTYEPATGVVEVVANDSESREAMTRIMVARSAGDRVHQREIAVPLRPEPASCSPSVSRATPPTASSPSP